MPESLFSHSPLSSSTQQTYYILILLSCQPPCASFITDTLKQVLTYGASATGSSTTSGSTAADSSAGASAASGSGSVTPTC